MDFTAHQLETLSEELNLVLDVMRDLVNEVKIIHEMISPQLANITKDVRTKRQTLTVEVSKILKDLNDCRSFFLDENYTVEIQRFTETIQTMEKLRDLAKDGTMKALTDAALTIAETQNTRKKIDED